MTRTSCYTQRKPQNSIQRSTPTMMPTPPLRRHEHASAKSSTSTFSVSTWRSWNYNLICQQGFALTQSTSMRSSCSSRNYTRMAAKPLSTWTKSLHASSRIASSSSIKRWLWTALSLLLYAPAFLLECISSRCFTTTMSTTGPSRRLCKSSRPSSATQTQPKPC